MQVFTPATLAKFAGQEADKPIYVAHNGTVYDVSDSKLWPHGLHMRLHQAGRDLTAEISAAPHGLEMLSRVPTVGVLRAEVDPRLPPWLASLLARVPFLRRHPHPMLVHPPLVFFSAAPGFTLLALLTGNYSFDSTAFHCLGAGILFTPLTIASGLFTWWLNYRAQPLRQVKIKIWGSACLLPTAIAAFSWRWAMPDILTTPAPARLAYLLLLCALPLLVGTVGWFGAQLTFPLEKKGQVP